jgi:hypothetical protein
MGRDKALSGKIAGPPSIERPVAAVTMAVLLFSPHLFVVSTRQTRTKAGLRRVCLCARAWVCLRLWLRATLSVYGHDVYLCFLLQAEADKVQKDVSHRTSLWKFNEIPGMLALTGPTADYCNNLHPTIDIRTRAR